MGTYVEYQLADGETVLVEIDEPLSGPIKAADETGNVVIRAHQNLDQALATIRRSITAVKQELSLMETDELEVTFGIKTVGELGLFAIAKAGAEVNYTITARWKKHS